MRNSSYSWGRLGDARPAALCGAGEDDGDEADLAEEASVRGSESNLASSAGNCRSGSEELITFVD